MPYETGEIRHPCLVALRADSEAEMHEFVAGNVTNHYDSRAPHFKPCISLVHEQYKLYTDKSDAWRYHVDILTLFYYKRKVKLTHKD
jgi:hypothetical protein